MQVYTNPQIALLSATVAAISVMFFLPDAAFLALSASLFAVATVWLLSQRYSREVEAMLKAAVEFGRSMVSAEEAETCCVCLEELPSPDCEGEIRKLSCGHCFHRCCVDEWLQRCPTCPLCKARAKPSTLGADRPPRQWQDKLHRARDPYRGTTPEQSQRLKAVCLQMLQNSGSSASRGI